MKELLKQFQLNKNNALKAPIGVDTVYVLATEAYYWRLFQMWNKDYASMDTTDFRNLNEMLQFFEDFLDEQLKSLEDEA